MGILETNKQFYDNLRKQKNPLAQFVGGFGGAVNDAFKGPVDAVNKEVKQFKKEGPKGYINKKKEQAEKIIKEVHNANQEIVKYPKKALNTTKNYLVDTMKEEWNKAKENPAATLGDVAGNVALMAVDAGAANAAGKVFKVGSKAANAVEKGVEKVNSANTASKGITKAKSSEYPANTPVKKVRDFPEEEPVLKNIEDMKVVKTPKAQPVKEDLVDINSLKKNPPPKAQPTINEQLYNMKNGDLRKAPSDVEQLYLEQYKKYPEEMFKANPTRGTNTRLMTDWAEDLVGKAGYSNVLRGQIFRGLRRNSTKLPTMNMGGAIGRDFNRQVLEGADPYWLYHKSPIYKAGSTVGYYEPFYDTINIANRRYAQAIYDYNGVKKSIGDIYPHEVTHKVIQNLEEEALNNPNNRTLSEKIKEMRTLVGEPREPLNASETLAKAFPAALNTKYQSQFAPSYGTGKLNDIGVLRNAEDWWRKELGPYAFKREERRILGPNLAVPQPNRDMSLFDYMKILDDEENLKRMEDL